MRSSLCRAWSVITCPRSDVSSWLHATPATSADPSELTMRQFTLPDLGEGLEEAEIVAWFVNQGDHVVANQPLVSVETDKAVVEVPSPWNGTIARLHGAKGDLVKVGAPLVEFRAGDEDTGTIVGEIARSEAARASE